MHAIRTMNAAVFLGGAFAAMAFLAVLALVARGILAIAFGMRSGRRRAA